MNARIIALLVCGPARIGNHGRVHRLAARTPYSTGAGLFWGCTVGVALHGLGLPASRAGASEDEQASDPARGLFVKRLLSRDAI